MKKKIIVIGHVGTKEILFYKLLGGQLEFWLKWRLAITAIIHS